MPMSERVPPQPPWTVFSDRVGLRTQKKDQLIDLTQLVAERVRRSGVRFGLASVQAPPAAVEVLGEEDTVGAERRDAPSAQTFQVAEGTLQLGRGRRVVLAEHDGPCARNVSILVLGVAVLS